MKCILYKYNLYITALILVAGAPLLAQDMNKEVYVVSSYKPEIADADRIATLPIIPDTFSFDTEIEYTLLPSRLRPEFDPRPIKAAKMVGTSLDKLYKSYARAGIGNYTTPMLEYSIHNLRSKEYAVGASFYHKSSHAKREIAQVKDVPAGYGRNQLHAYGKKFYNDFNVLAEAGAWNHKIRHYGISPLLGDTTEVETEDIRQNYKALYGKVGLQSVETDSSSLQYSMFLGGTHFSDQYDHKAPHVELTASVYSPLKFFYLGLDFDLNYYNQNVDGDSAQHTLTGIYPYFRMQKDQWRFKVGPRIVVQNTAFGQDSYFFLKGLFAYDIVPGVFTGFAGVDGYVQPNSYQNLYARNPYIIPGAYAPNTRYPFIIYAGLEGKISPKAAYRVDVRFENQSDAVFFVNSDSGMYDNQYSVVIADLDRMRLHGELSWQAISNLNFFSRFNYYSYSTSGTDEAWHMPAFDLNLSAQYTFKEKVSARLEYFYIGERKAADINVEDGVITLSAINDINLLLDYKYSDVLGFFLHLHNLANQKYFLWNQYPVQGLNVMLGAGYKF